MDNIIIISAIIIILIITTITITVTITIIDFFIFEISNLFVIELGFYSNLSQFISN
jgi:hypothetical protein